MLAAGLNTSKQVTNFFTVLKMLLVIFMIVVGFTAFDASNLSVANVKAEAGAEATTIVPSGIFAGAISCTFGYVGYDEVCCLAGETKNPRRIMHLAVFGTILACTLLYVIASFSLVAMVPYNTISQDSGFASAFQTRNMQFAYQITSVGELLTLPLTVLVSFLGQPRVMLAMARDNLAPRLFKETNSSGNLLKSIVVNGVACTLLALFVPFIYLENMVSAGILLNFNCTNSSLIVLRTRDAKAGLSDYYDALSSEGSESSDTQNPFYSEESISSPGTKSIHNSSGDTVRRNSASLEASGGPSGASLRKFLVWSATSPEGLLVLFHVTSMVVAFCISQLVLAVEASPSSVPSGPHQAVTSNAVLVAVGCTVLVFIAHKINKLITSYSSCHRSKCSSGGRHHSPAASLASLREDSSFAPIPGSPAPDASTEEESDDALFFDVDIHSPSKRPGRKSSIDSARQTSDTSSDNSLVSNLGYRLRGFPYVPLAGILVNYALLAQLPTSGLQFLAGYVGMCLLCYIATVNLIPQELSE